MVDASEYRELKDTSYELFILLLSLMSIFNLIIIILPRVDPVIKDVIEIVDIFITVVFFFDFLKRLFTAESKHNYFFRNWGWADFLASMPVRQLKIFRIFRIVRVIRLLGEFGFSNMLAEIRSSRAQSALYLTFFMIFLTLEFGGMGIVFAEAGNPDANIQTGGDGVWWSFVTIATVGYGDRYPVTQLGRFIGFVIIVLGVCTFGVLTGFLANIFFSEEDDISEERSLDTRSEISEFRRLLEVQESLNVALRKELEKIESSTEL